MPSSFILFSRCNLLTSKSSKWFISNPRCLASFCGFSHGARNHPQSQDHCTVKERINLKMPVLIITLARRYRERNYSNKIYYILFIEGKIFIKQRKKPNNFTISRILELSSVPFYTNWKRLVVYILKLADKSLPQYHIVLFGWTSMITRRVLLLV